MDFIFSDPGPPADLKVTNKDTSTFLVTCKKPNDARGRIQFYQFDIEVKGPTYYVPPDEECQPNIPNTTITFETSPNYEFEFAKPSNEYFITAKANTSAGFGPNRTQYHNTLDGSKCLCQAISKFCEPFHLKIEKSSTCHTTH